LNRDGEYDTESGQGLRFTIWMVLIKAICLALTAKRLPHTQTSFVIFGRRCVYRKTSLERLMGVIDRAVAKWKKKHVLLPNFAEFAMRAIYMEQVKAVKKPKTRSRRSTRQNAG
jgi:hypothetical protein